MGRGCSGPEGDRRRAAKDREAKRESLRKGTGRTGMKGRVVQRDLAGKKQDAKVKYHKHQDTENDKKSSPRE